jgi:hypothetical protein
MTNIIAMALAAVLAVESQNGADRRTGDGGRAVGAFQMWPVAVREANRVESIMSRREGRRPRKWRVSDRADIDKAREMCEATLRWHYRRGGGWRARGGARAGLWRGVTDPVALACKWRNPYSRCPEWHRRKIEKAVKKGNKK